MTPLELEIAARHAVDRIIAGQQIEDSTIEVKSTFPTDHRRAAKQIGGLSNANPLSKVIWIVGIDERKSDFVDYDQVEIANWWPSVRKHFDGGVYPQLNSNIRIDHNGKPIDAMSFSTDLAPYIVNTQQGRLVPYREGNSTEAIRRQQLIRLLSQQFQTPRIFIDRVTASPDGVSVFMTVQNNLAKTVQIVATRIAGKLVDANGRSREIRVPQLFRHGLVSDKVPAFPIETSASVRLDFQPSARNNQERYLTDSGWSAFEIAVYFPESGNTYAKASVSLEATPSGFFEYRFVPQI